MLAGAIGLVVASIVLQLRASQNVVDRPALRQPFALHRETSLQAVGEDALIAEFTRRLNHLGKNGTRLIAKLTAGLQPKGVGQLVEGLTAVRRLDYPRYPIHLLISSPTVAKRLGSVAKEPFTVEWIEQNVNAGDVFYDIGANVGPYSLIAAKATRGGAQVFAFEPAPASYRDLARNVTLNDCGQCITPLPIVLWSETTLLPASWRSPDAGSSRHRIGERGERAASRIVAMRIDDLVDALGVPAPTHAKIDVDGYELEVLRGAQETLAQPEWRSLIIELDPEETDRNWQIKELLAKAGFDEGVRHPRQPSKRYPNPDQRPDVYWTFTRSIV